MTGIQCAEVSLEFNRHIINLLDSLSALSELAALSIHDFDESQLLKHALEALMSNQDMERCSIFLLDENGILTNAAGLDWEGMLQGLTQTGADLRAPPRPITQYRLGDGIMGCAAETGVIQHCHSCADDPRFKDFGSSGAQVEGALICVPVTCEKQVLGVLNVFYPQAGFFNMWHERLLLLFCQVLGRLLLNHRFTHHLSSLLDDRTQEIMAANATLREEVALKQEAQNKLALQYSFLQSVMDSAPEPVMVIGTDYSLLMANAPARKNAPQLADGETWTCHQVSHHRDTPCDGAEHQCPLRMVIAQNGPASVVHEHFSMTGEPRQVELLASPLRDKDGTIIGIIESARDITERKRVEEALRESEEKFRLISSAAKDAIVIIGPEEEIIYWNPAAESMFGYPADEALGQNLHHLIAPSRHHEDAHRGFDHFRLSGEGPLIGKTLEMTALRRNSDEFPIELSISAVRIKGCWHALGMIRDISERRKAEQEYKTIIHTAMDGFLVVDAHAGGFLDANEAYCKMLGYSREEVLRMRISDVEAIESPEQVRLHTEELRSSGCAQFETRHLRKDGQIIDVEISATYLNIRGGVLIVFVRDITERKLNELKIRQLAYYDTLTNLPNRRMLLSRLPQVIAQAKRHQRAMAIMFLDLDRFKYINDTLGHDAGDDLLKVVATRLNACVRAEDMVCRQGGDEFVIVLAEVAHPQDAALIAEKIIGTLGQSISIKGHELQITTSIGIALFPVNGTDNAQELMKKADAAMYVAKEAGRNGYRFADIG